MFTPEIAVKNYYNNIYKYCNLPAKTALKVI